MFLLLNWLNFTVIEEMNGTVNHQIRSVELSDWKDFVLLFFVAEKSFEFFY